MFDQWSTLHMTLGEIEAALSDENAYFFFIKHGRPHKGPLELVRYFLENRQPAIHHFDVDDESQLPLFV